MDLDVKAEKYLKSNIEILFDQLSIAIEDYRRDGFYMGELRFVNAYLSATLNAMVSYIERLIEVGRVKNSGIIEALKFANNLQKHNKSLVSIPRPIGGFEFPFFIGKDGFEFLEINIVWDECVGLKTKKESQKTNYEKYFQDRPIIETLKPIVDKLILEGTIIGD